MQRILVPCDFSSPAQEAYKLAAGIAAKNNGEVLLLHVINIPVVYDPGLGGLPYTDPTLLEDLEAASIKAGSAHATADAWRGGTGDERIRRPWTLPA